MCNFKTLLFTLLIFFIYKNGISQGTQPDIPMGNYIVLGIGNSKISVSETINTSVPYSGWCTATAVEGIFGSEKHYWHIRNAYSFGTITPYQSVLPNKNTEDAYDENLSITRYWRFYQNQPQHVYLYAGPVVNTKIGLRFKNGAIGNSAMSYEGALGVGIALKAAKYFNISKKHNKPFKRFKAEATLLLPVVSKIFHPNYLGISETALSENRKLIDWSSNYTGYFNSLEYGVSLSYYLKNKNALQLAYKRNFFSTKPEYNPVKIMNQSIVFKLLFNLK